MAVTADPHTRGAASVTGAARSFEDVRRRADAEAAARGWQARTTGVSHFRALGLHLALLWPSHADRGTGFGQPLPYYDADTGVLLHALVPGRGTAGDRFAQMQFPLHSGQVAGLAGRIAVAMLGGVVAVLGATGIVIWWRKRGARLATPGRSTRSR